MTEEQASEEFWDSFQYGGSSISQCACGRTHFAVGQYTELGEDEIEEMREKLRANRDKYVECPDDSVCIASIGGGIVYGCPCGTSKRYETFLESNRDDILKYYRKRLAAEKEKAAKLADGLEGLEVK